MGVRDNYPLCVPLVRAFNIYWLEVVAPVELTVDTTAYPSLCCGISVHTVVYMMSVCVSYLVHTHWGTYMWSSEAGHSECELGVYHALQPLGVWQQPQTAARCTEKCYDLLLNVPFHGGSSTHMDTACSPAFQTGHFLAS